MKRLIYADELKSDILSKMYLAQKEYLHKSHIIHQIDIAPTVDAVEVVHGRWERSEYHGFLRCSQCKDVYIDDSWVADGKWNYCPNCGASMRGEEDA